jgi:Flp pilus assembly protein TadG
MREQIKSVIAVPPITLVQLARIIAGDAGNNVVEFALAATVFLTVVFGVMAFSMVVFYDLLTSNAAREGTRYAVVRGSSWASDCSTPGPANCTAQTADVQTYARSRAAFAGVNTSNLAVSTTWLTSSGGSCGTADSCKVPGNRVKVTATYSYAIAFPFITGQTFTMSSTSQMVIAQ